MNHDKLIKELNDMIITRNCNGAEDVMIRAIEALKAEQDKADYLERLVASNTRIAAEKKVAYKEIGRLNELLSNANESIVIMAKNASKAHEEVERLTELLTEGQPSE